MMKKDNSLFSGSLRLILPAVLVPAVAALVSGHTSAAAGLILGSAIIVANFFLLERIVRSLRGVPAVLSAKSATAVWSVSAKILVKTLVACALLAACAAAFGALAVFAGVLLGSISYLVSGMRTSKCR
jgi:hypothetical protein